VGTRASNRKIRLNPASHDQENQLRRKDNCRGSLWKRLSLSDRSDVNVAVNVSEDQCTIDRSVDLVYFSYGNARDNKVSGSYDRIMPLIGSDVRHLLKRANNWAGIIQDPNGALRYNVLIAKRSRPKNNLHIRRSRLNRDIPRFSVQRIRRLYITLLLRARVNAGAHWRKREIARSAGGKFSCKLRRRDKDLKAG